MQFYMYIVFVVTLFLLCSTVGSTASVNITHSRFLKDPDEITSDNNFFKLGFFSPPNSSHRFVGIWYNTGISDDLEVVWVANKENPVKDSSGLLTLSEDGNLQVLDGHNKLLWSSNSTHHNKAGSSSLLAQLLDTGNLVVLSNERIIWQSFQDPTDTLLPQMRNGVYQSENKVRKVVQSWKSRWDPSRGRFTIGMTPHKPAEGFVWDNGRPYWRTGPWNGNFFIGLPQMYYWVLLYDFTLQNDNKGLPTLTFSSEDPAAMDHYVLNYDGVVLHKEWNRRDHKWDVLWKSIESECDVYGKCGPFGKCNPKKHPICSCLEGFQPTNYQEWNKGNWTSGCSRKTPLQCGTDEFLRLENVKVPDFATWVDTDNEDDCRNKCQDRCSCLGYAYYLGIGCMFWNTTLLDIQEFNVTSVDLFIRLAHSELPDKNRRIIVAIIITGTIIFLLVAFFVRRWINQRMGMGALSNDKLMHNKLLELYDSKVDFKDLPLFKFEKLAAATNNFHESNKLGRGGFGPVFKGKLQDGQEIAVKRLSSSSGQGLREFMNEVLLISKLQHRNLVRLLGCCVEEDEKMLIYEYMPNKSLDALLFDPSLGQYLDWKRRYNIIEGICRGLLYLHRDSRLKIIHRDLKASNILLDEDLNPKISDFGMARIFGSKQDQENTSRVVGTLGYMSPEYVMGGRFSEKSDVYSFGVLLLEIVSGRKNSSFTYEDDQCTSLLEYAWRLWNEGGVLSLIDPSIGDSSSHQGKILKCIHIGLLCVQEFAEDRPTISGVVSMLDDEFSDVPCPTQPGFVKTRNSVPDNITPNSKSHFSDNYASVTLVSGR